MSDHIPFEMQSEIMKRLPVKSLIQFRSVSKPWKAFIDSSDFIANYHRNHHHQQHLLISYADPQCNSYLKCVSIVDNDTFPQHKFPLTLPESVQQFYLPILVAGSQGLFCLYDFHIKSGNTVSSTAVIWNPAIRKTVDVVVPNVSVSASYFTVLGFGVCPHTNDPKLVKTIFDTSDCIGFWEVEVFTLSSGVWRSPKSSNLPTNSTELIEVDNVAIDGSIYWFAFDMVDSHLIMSFDLTKEEFAKVYLPDSLSIIGFEAHLSLSKLRDSLIVFQSSYKDVVPLFSCGVWMMENGDPKSFTKILTIAPPDNFVRMVLGFRKSGETILEVIEEEHDALALYERDSEHINHIGFSGKRYTFNVRCYMETLLLFDH